MKKNTKIIIGLVILLVLILIPILPFLIIPGKYNFQEFWSYFFTKIFSWSTFASSFWPIIQVIPVTLEATFFAALFGLLLGLALALVKINKIPILDQLRALFVSFMRGTPIIVQLYLMAFGIPLILRGIDYNYGMNWNMNSVPTILILIITFALNEGAYQSETIRSAINSVDIGQIEAAKSLGMSGFQVFKRVTLPEASRVALAPLGNALLGMLKSTSLGSVVAVTEMTFTATILGGAASRQFETYIALALVYWAICIVLENLIRLLERHLEIRMPNDKRKNRAAISFTRNPFDNNVEVGK